MENKHPMKKRGNMQREEKQLVNRARAIMDPISYIPMGSKINNMHTFCQENDNESVLKQVICPRYKKASPKRVVHGAFHYNNSVSIALQQEIKQPISKELKVEYLEHMETKDGKKKGES